LTEEKAKFKQNKDKELLDKLEKDYKEA